MYLHSLIHESVFWCFGRDGDCGRNGLHKELQLDRHSFNQRKLDNDHIREQRKRQWSGQLHRGCQHNHQHAHRHNDHCRADVHCDRGRDNSTPLLYFHSLIHQSVLWFLRRKR